jgi:hypothetical protein
LGHENDGTKTQYEEKGFVLTVRAVGLGFAERSFFCTGGEDPGKINGLDRWMEGISMFARFSET